MLSVDIGIGHDNDLMVAEFGYIDLFTDTATECGDHRADLGVVEYLMCSCLFNIQDLSS